MDSDNDLSNGADKAAVSTVFSAKYVLIMCTEEEEYWGEVTKGGCS